MDFALSPEEQRVLGSLMEKAATTPEVYPLTLNSLVAACNQRSNRNPVVDYDEPTVLAALDSLRELGLARRVDSAGARTAKFRHVINEALGLTQSQSALICVLLLRGPQTVGELRTRTERLHAFRDLQAAQDAINSLLNPAPEAEFEAPLVAALPLRPGSREIRYVHTLGETTQTVDVDPSTEVSEGAPVAVQARATKAEVDALREEVEQLRTALETLRAEFDGLKSELM